jgi:hypothetical protein
LAPIVSCILHLTEVTTIIGANLGRLRLLVAAELLVPLLLGWRWDVSGLLGGVVLFFFATSLVLKGCKREAIQVYLDEQMKFQRKIIRNNI